MIAFGYECIQSLFVCETDVLCYPAQPHTHAHTSRCSMMECTKKYSGTQEEPCYSKKQECVPVYGYGVGLVFIDILMIKSINLRNVENRDGIYAYDCLLEYFLEILG